MPHDFIMPGFNNAAAAPDGQKHLCETNPICPGIGSQRSGIGGLTPDPRPRNHELSCKTNPICDPLTGKGTGGPGRKCCSARGQTRQTNPIRRRRKGGTSAVWKRGYNELYLSLGSAKQSQFPAVPGGARPEERGPRVLYKQTQSGGGAYRAKRSQFADPRDTHHSTIPPFHHSSPMPIVRNEANSREPRRTTSGWWDSGYESSRRFSRREKRSQFRRGGRGAGAGMAAAAASGTDCANQNQFAIRPVARASCP
jgi:hypothetical protein